MKRFRLTQTRHATEVESLVIQKMFRSTMGENIAHVVVTKYNAWIFSGPGPITDVEEMVLSIPMLTWES